MSVREIGCGVPNRAPLSSNMTEDLLRRTLQRGGGCRLCMAPDSECVPIFATAAADKEPLSSKIMACVSVKVSALHESCAPRHLSVTLFPISITHMN